MIMPSATNDTFGGGYTLCSMVASVDRMKAKSVKSVQTKTPPPPRIEEETGKPVELRR